MDKSFGTLYQKLSNLFQSNPSTSTAPETSSSSPLSTFLDRIVPSINNSPMDQRRTSSRISRQISIKTTDDRIEIPNDNT
jgi:hypothetical protein